MFNKVFLVNHWRDVLNCSCRWLCFSNANRCIDHPVLIMFPFSLFKDYVLEKYATKVILDELNVF